MERCLELVNNDKIPRSSMSKIRFLCLYDFCLSILFPINSILNEREYWGILIFKISSYGNWSFFPRFSFVAVIIENIICLFQKRW